MWRLNDVSVVYLGSVKQCYVSQLGFPMQQPQVDRRGMSLQYQSPIVQGYRYYSRQFASGYPSGRQGAIPEYSIYEQECPDVGHGLT